MPSIRRIWPIFAFLLFFLLDLNFSNARLEILKKNTGEEVGGPGLKEPGKAAAAAAAPETSLSPVPSSPSLDLLLNVRGSVQEVPLPDGHVQLHSAIRKVQIVKAAEKKGRAKREVEEELELEVVGMQNEGEGEEERRGLESIVDEVDGEMEEEEKPKTKKKTFSKQAVKKEAKGEKGAGTAPGGGGAEEKKPTEQKKPSAGTQGSGTAATTASSQPAPKGAGGKADLEKDKEGKGLQAGAPTPKPAAAGTPPPPPPGDSKAAAKEKPPASAQVPQGPPMPPPGAVPAPAPQKPSDPDSSSQSQPPAEAARPSGLGKVPNYKLIYFDARGICEPIRLLFNYAKVAFDDVRISRKQWLALKDSTVYGKVPILEVDGKPLTYCHTIARYLARQFGLAGKDSWEQAKVDEISDFHADVAMDLQPYMYVVAGFHQGDKNTLRQAIFLPNVEKHFPVYVNLLKLSGSGFFMPSGITWVDFVIAEYMTTVRHFEPQILDKYPAITKFVRKVQTQPQIFEYVTNREHQPV